MKRALLILICSLLFAVTIYGQSVKTNTIALWAFDEQQGIYPSSALADHSDNDYPLVIGPGGMIVPGKFGNALEPIEQPKVTYPINNDTLFGLAPMKPLPGRKIPPLTWANANFCALMTNGENHLRKEVGFANVTKTKLNLGGFDWTVEFWFQKDGSSNGDGVVFEMGQGPRGDNNNVTKLVLKKDLGSFLLLNSPSNVLLSIPTDRLLLADSKWHHIAFAYDSKEKQIKHYVDGKLQTLPGKSLIKSLPFGEEAYMSIGRDGIWNNPLQGKIDELRFLEGQIYRSNFTPPESFSPLYNSSYVKEELKKGPPLLFDKEHKDNLPIKLMDRKYLFIDDGIVESMKNVTFNVNPPRYADRVIDNVEGGFRKHLNVMEDEKGLIRLYTGVEDNYLAVWVSKDGKNFTAPDLNNGEYKGRKNVVIHEPCAMGMTFIDPNAPLQERWKYVSDFNRRGIYIWVSPDGYNFKRIRTPVLPFRAGSQSNIFYDDQKQEYVSYHRSDLWATITGETERGEVMTITTDLDRPWEFKPLTQQQQIEISKKERTHKLFPWYLDNGPLTPGGFGFEYPRIFKPVDTLDPSGTDIYVPKAVKYQWASDVYLAFPVMYFHYEGETLPTRLTLADEKRGMGGGVTDMQLQVSRDGINWKRYPRPTYIPIGKYDGDNIKQAYIAEGLIRRGDEIWQYFFGDEKYHSTWEKGEKKRAVYRVIQRLDGFVSADSPYDKEALLVTKPLVFKGSRLVLNINTSGTGYTQAGFLDENGNPIEGFTVDDCVYVNDNSVAHEVEWLNKGKDVSELEGKIVQVVFRMRGSKLFAMQFTD